MRRKTLNYFAVGLLLGGCSHTATSEATPTDTPTPEVKVTLTRVRRGDIEATASAIGTLYPRVQVTVSSKLSAPLAHMEILRNRKVTRGQLLTVQETRDLEAQRNEAVAAVREARVGLLALSGGAIPLANAQAARDLADARANQATARALYDRRKGLFRKGGIALRDLEASRLALVNADHGLALTNETVGLRTSAINPDDRAAASAKVQAAQERVQTFDTQIAYATLRAPISGTVTEQLLFQGEFLAAGAKLLTITDLSEIIVKTPFPDLVAARLRVGDSARIEPSDRPGKVLHGRISVISSTSDPTNRSVEIWVPLLNPDGKLRTGGSARVTVTVQRHRNALLIPRSALNNGTVMTVDARSIAHQQNVKVGIASGGQLEILAGLEAGQSIVKEGNFALPDGARVNP